MEIGMHTRKTKKRVSSLSWKRLFIACFFVAGTCLPWMISAKSTENQAVVQQAITIKGVVQDETGEPLIGVGVMVKGTATGTITDLDGNFSIQTTIGSVLVFSYVGYFNQEIKVESSQSLNVVMKISATEIEEVVVTAMGVVAEKKKMNFAVQSLGSDELVAGNALSIASTLQGKVSGLQITNAGGSPNAGSQIQIRSISSINPSQNNEPLIVLDGMPITGGGSSLADINPNDIENLTVLKGAAASALYGQEGANGVLMITTKSGKAGGLTVSVNATAQLDYAARVPKIQSKFTSGTRGFRDPLAGGGWGPLIQPGEPVYDNVNEFFQPGFMQKYDVSVSGGSERFNSYVSANYMKNEGIVPNDYQNKFGLFFKSNAKLSNTVSLNIQANTTSTISRGFGNSMEAIYNWPITNNMSNYINPDTGEMIRRNPFDQLYDGKYMDGAQRLTVPINPYWSRYEDDGKNDSFRNILSGALSWEPIKDLLLTGKVSYDRKNYESDSYTTARYKKSDFLIEDTEGNVTDYSENVPSERWGSVKYSQSKSELLTVNALVNYKVNIQKDWDVYLLAGAEFQQIKSLASAMYGTEFTIPDNGIYSFQNISNLEKDDITLYHRERRKGGVFGELRFDYKGIVQVSGTGRTDFSSTLSKVSYFYPSVTAGIVVSELFNISGDVFSFGKIRGNWAKIGKDTSTPYVFDKKFREMSTFPDGGYALDPTRTSAVILEPEMTNTWEIGTDIRFFNNNTRFDIAYYSSTVDNQIVNVRVSPTSGTILQTRNEGSIENYGLEFQWGQTIFDRKEFRWNSTLNFSFNRGRVRSLPEDIIELTGSQFGSTFTSSYLNGSTTAISGKDYLRNSHGDIICDANGMPKINPEKSVLIGDREPDFLLGINNDLKYKKWNLSFLIDTRKGGDVFNYTLSSLIGSGQSKFMETYRNREILVKGVVEQADGSFRPNNHAILLDKSTMDNITSVGSNFIEDGSYIRLSYLTIGYDFSELVRRSPFRDLRVSFTGRNLLLLTKYTGSDPQINADPSAKGGGSKGIDNFAVPSTRSFSINLIATF